MDDSLKKKYIGKRVNIFPTDSVTKYGVIKDVDELGFTILIDRVEKSYIYTEKTFVVGATIFVPHSLGSTFIFV